MNLFGSFFQQQNDKIANGSSDEQGAQYVHLDTLGIINGLLEMVVQGETSIEFAYNNVRGHDPTKPDGTPVC